MATVSVRYIVNDVDEAIGFYTGLLGFGEPGQRPPAHLRHAVALLISGWCSRLLPVVQGVDKPGRTEPSPRLVAEQVRHRSERHRDLRRGTAQRWCPFPPAATRNWRQVSEGSRRSPTTRPATRSRFSSRSFPRQNCELGSGLRCDCSGWSGPLVVSVLRGAGSKPALVAPEEGPRPAPLSSR